jgi:hypothetical protein
MLRRIVVAAALAVVVCPAAVAVGVPPARGAQAPALEVRPRAAQRGGRVVFHGSGFAPFARVVLLAGLPQSMATRIGSARTDAEGRFVAPISIDREVRPGRYVALACRHRCRVKASASFRVLSR